MAENQNINKEKHKNHKKDTSHYISAKESRRISRENFKTVRALEKKKHRKNAGKRIHYGNARPA